MRRYVAPLAAATLVAAAFFAPSASARDSFSIAIGAPGFAVGYASPGYAYAPPPVYYYEPRVYYAPPPVYYSPRVVYYGYRPWHHRRHYYYPY